MNVKHLLGAMAIALGVLTSNAKALDVLFTENFEAIVPSAFLPVGGYLTATAPDFLDLGGTWSITTGSVDLIRQNYGAIDNVSLDLSGSTAGTIVRTFNAIAGRTYELSWDLFRNAGGSAFTVGLGTSTYTLPAGLIAALGAPVRGMTFDWTAQVSGPATVSFGGGLGNAGPTIDNIVLTAMTPIPEPGAMALILAGLTVVALLGRRRLPNAR